MWRDRLLVKLYDKGINGALWTWIADFLQDRNAACVLKRSPGITFLTELGLPQGSVLSPVLFNLFISDIYDGLASKKVKIADDGTIWLTGDSPNDLSLEMAKDSAIIANWAYKWRMKLKNDKTENCLFTRNPEHTVPTVVEGKGSEKHRKGESFRGNSR